MKHRVMSQLQLNYRDQLRDLDKSKKMLNIIDTTQTPLLDLPENITPEWLQEELKAERLNDAKNTLAYSLRHMDIHVRLEHRHRRKEIEELYHKYSAQSNFVILIADETGLTSVEVEQELRHLEII